MLILQASEPFSRFFPPLIPSGTVVVVQASGSWSDPQVRVALLGVVMTFVATIGAFLAYFATREQVVLLQEERNESRRAQIGELVRMVHRWLRLSETNPFLNKAEWRRSARSEDPFSLAVQLHHVLREHRRGDIPHDADALVRVLPPPVFEAYSRLLASHESLHRARYAWEQLLRGRNADEYPDLRTSTESEALLTAVGSFLDALEHFEGMRAWPKQIPAPLRVPAEP